MEKVINLGKEGEEKVIMLQKEAIVLGGGAVNSVNGQTGDVVLTTSDLENTSDYQTSEEVESAISSAIAGKQDTLTAGANITIENNTISATNTTYTAGYGLSLSGNEFVVDSSTIPSMADLDTKQDALEAGTGIDITGDTISVDTDVIQEKLTAGENITIEDGTISATGGGSSVNVVQTTGNSTTDVMSQDATTKMVIPTATSVGILASEATGLNSIAIGNKSSAYQSGSISIGGGSSTTSAARTQGVNSIAIGSNTVSYYSGSIAVGVGSRARSESVSLGDSAGAGGSANAIENVYLGHQAGSVSHSNSNSVALGHYSQITRNGEVSVGASVGTSGYNNTGYRVIGNVYDGQDAHDAVTVGQINSVIDAINAALGSSISHVGA